MKTQQYYFTTTFGDLCLPIKSKFPELSMFIKKQN